MILIINKNGDVMIVSLQNPNGGPKMRKFPLVKDPDTGIMGYALGHCTCGCQKPLVIQNMHLQKFVIRFQDWMANWEQAQVELFRAELKVPRVPIRHRIVRLLGGRIGD